MSYRPPTSSKWSTVVQQAPVTATHVSIPSCFTRHNHQELAEAPASSMPSCFSKKGTVGTTDSANSFPFQSRSTNNEKTGDWGAFGGKPKKSMDNGEHKKTLSPNLLEPRNSLAAYVNLVTKDMPPVEEKWEQSAIRRKPIETPKAVETFEDKFPSLTPSSSKTDLQKSASKNSLSMADRMKQRLVEEEEAAKQKAEEEARRFKKREEEEKSIGLHGIVKSIVLNRTARRYDTYEDQLAYKDSANDEDIECDAYGYPLEHDDSHPVDTDDYPDHDEYA